MSTNQYTNRIPAYEKSFIENEKRPEKYISSEVKKKANPIYKTPVQFFDSPVHGSHLYPNMYLIKPVNNDYIPVNQSKYLDESIKQGQRFVLGPYVIENKQLERWS